MSLLLAMLPIYLFGNLHCLGMCGPLVMMIGQHQYRYFYFLGRLFSFTIAGTIAGALGTVTHLFFKQYHLAEAACFFFGTILLVLGYSTLAGWHYPGYHWLAKKLSSLNKNISLLMLRDQAWPAFLFGLFTIALPCGQTLIVFSACALSGEISTGFINGLAFALLTSPSLILAMQAHSFFHYAKRYYQVIVGVSAILVGFLAFLRGLAEMDLISHWVLNPNASHQYHIIIF